LKPYYDDGQCVIYHGDCREILPALNVDPALVLTDPPYGMDYSPMRAGTRSTAAQRRVGREIHGDREAFDPSHLLVFESLVLFGANWYADRLPPSGGWIVWDKTPRIVREGWIGSHAELAWTNLAGHVLKFSMQWGGEARNGEPSLHPAQKPIALMRWILALYTEPDWLVLDPYMGSGPIGVACRETRRRYIGIEIEERYCEIAAKRLAQEVLPLGEVSG
jgi:site-specific DNA-methyltransferase (adenine-specific)